MSNKLKILICGDRHWGKKLGQRELLEHIMSYFSNTIIIQGGCDGADLMASEVAHKRGLGVIQVDADWKRCGSYYDADAGPRRNAQMLEHKPHLVIAFHDSIETSKGTKDMVKQAVDKGFKVVIYSTTKTPQLFNF